MLTSVGVILSIIIAMWNIDRSRRKDLKKEFDKKADLIHVASELKLRDNKITYVESLTKMQDVYLKETLEEHHAILDTVQTDIKEILKRLK